MTPENEKLSNDPEEMLKSKKADDVQKQQFTEFVQSLGNTNNSDHAGKVSEEEHREPDMQNHMKSVENLRN
ncbi:hypothetical protein [Paenibacillus sanguinis]|uniref:hypothetical protein n=1 Tax=Paenibacillus sanguinis TaxID=225906 RepID=UPI000369BE9A|nr:hypothetical protein [Paenibacillus sanguinis]